MSDISTEMVNSAPTGGFGGAEYNLVAKGAKLEAINLFCTRFDINPELLAEERNWKLNYGRKILSCQFSEEQSSVVAVFQYYVIAKFGRKRALSCSADYGVFYETPDGATTAGAVGFCRNVGTFAAYPYFRALFAQLSGEAGLSLPPLPAIASTAHIPPKQISEG
jgi:hypothetical protein